MDARNQPNFRSLAALRQQALEIYHGIFETAPHAYLILTPDLTIVEGNVAYLRATNRARDHLVGRYMFEAFPDNPDDPLATGVKNLSASLERARTGGCHDIMPLQRYDLREPDGKFWPHYWKPQNWPILDDAGHVLVLVHHVVEVSAPGNLSGYATELHRTTRHLLAQQRELLDRAEMLSLARAKLTQRFKRP